MKLRNILNINNFNFLKVIKLKTYKDLLKLKINYQKQIEIKNNLIEFYLKQYNFSDLGYENFYKNLLFDYLALTKFEKNNKVLLIGNTLENVNINILSKFGYSVNKVNSTNNYLESDYSLILINEFSEEDCSNFLNKTNFIYIDSILPRDKNYVIDYLKKHKFYLINYTDIGFGLLFERI